MELSCPIIKPRIVKCLGRRLLVMGEEGELVSYNPESRTFSPLLKDESFSSYSVVEVDSDHNKLLVCGLKGQVSVGMLNFQGDRGTDFVVGLKSKCVLTGKIFACALDGEEILINGADGKLVLLEDSLLTVASGELPEMKHRWFTAACKFSGNWVLGDRCGGINVIVHEKSSELTVKQSISKLHGRMGVTSLSKDKDFLWSSGRDGYLRCFGYSDEGLNLLQALHVGYDWVAGVQLVWGEIACLVWHGARLLIKSIQGDCEWGSHECGGGHRSWDIMSTSDGGTLFYIKDKEVMMAKLWSSDKMVLLSGGHTQQVNVVTKFTSGSENFLATGGEETNIRIYQVNEGLCQEVAILRGHLSSLKCMAVQYNSDHIFLCSGGGRAELRVWSLRKIGHRLMSASVGTSLLRGADKSKKPWKLAQQEILMDGETRYMDIALRWMDNNRGALYIYLACSDAIIRVFSYDVEGQSLSLVSQTEYHRHCLLIIRLLEGLVLTATTGGNLSVWERNLLENESESKSRPMIDQQVHQSGVNCLSTIKNGLNSWQIVSGGDDTDFVVSVIYFQNGSVEYNRIWSSKNRLGHTAQVTGLSVSDRWVITSSVDQRIVVWNLAGDKCKWVVSKCGSVADVADIECWSEGDNLYCTVVGVGMEIVVFSLNHI